MLRMAVNDDLEALRALWLSRFDDEPAFADWFFRERFLPEYCAVLTEEGTILSCVHSLPAFIGVRNAILPCAIIAGVSTREGYGGRGLMHQMMRYYLNEMNRRGIALIAHRPQVLKTFFSLGHFPVSDTRYVTLPQGASSGDPDACKTVEILSHASELYRCYDAFSRRYSGVIRRSYADFVLKCRDYLSCRAGCAAVYEGTAVTGYCIYFETDDEVWGEECLALDDSAYRRLVDGMAARAGGKKLVLRTAGDADVSPAGATVEVTPKSVLGVTDVRAVLRTTGLHGCTLDIADDIVDANRGRFDVSGAPASGEPALRISAGRLIQWAVGYRSMAEIAGAGEAEALEPGVIERLDAIGKRPCFIFDEY